MYRDHTKVIQIGDRKIGGGNPILIQSMTNTKTEDVEQTVAQILALEQAGCDIIRCAVPTMEAAKALKEIKKQIHIPLVAESSEVIWTIQKPYRRGGKHHRTRYFCCADSRIYHYSGMLLLWNPAGCRSKPYLYHSAQYFCKDERRGFVGKSVLPVSDICCGFNDHCCI